VTTINIIKVHALRLYYCVCVFYLRDELEVLSV